MRPRPTRHEQHTLTCPARNLNSILLATVLLKFPTKGDCGLGPVPPERRIVGDVSVKLWTHIPQRPRGDKARE